MSNILSLSLNMWVTIEVWQKKGVSTVTSGLKETLHPVFVPWKETREGGKSRLCVYAILWKGPDGRVGQWGGGTGQDVGGHNNRGRGYGRGQGCAHLRSPGAWTVQLQQIFYSVKITLYFILKYPNSIAKIFFWDCTDRWHCNKYIFIFVFVICPSCSE